MKKSILIYFALFISCCAFPQQDIQMIFDEYYQENEVAPDSLTVIKLEYEILDSATITMFGGPLRNIHFPNIVSYEIMSYESGREIKLAYYTVDKNKWTAVSLPFNRTTNNFNLVNLDNKGQPELIVKGVVEQYGSGGGTGIRGMVILNIDSIPTQIFKIHYGCWIESFGDRHNNGEGRFFKEHEREIKITDNSIIIGSLDKKQYPFYECRLTEIPSGTYIMEAGQIRKKNNKHQKQ